VQFILSRKVFAHGSAQKFVQKLFSLEFMQFAHCTQGEALQQSRKALPGIAISQIAKFYGQKHSPFANTSHDKKLRGLT